MILNFSWQLTRIYFFVEGLWVASNLSEEIITLNTNLFLHYAKFVLKKDKILTSYKYPSIPNLLLNQANLISWALFHAEPSLASEAFLAVFSGPQGWQDFLQWIPCLLNHPNPLNLIQMWCVHHCKHPKP